VAFRRFSAVRRHEWHRTSGMTHAPYQRDHLWLSSVYRIKGKRIGQVMWVQIDPLEAVFEIFVFMLALTRWHDNRKRSSAKEEGIREI
jgi:hypothetical protein